MTFSHPFCQLLKMCEMLTGWKKSFFLIKRTLLIHFVSIMNLCAKTYILLYAQPNVMLRSVNSECLLGELYLLITQDVYTFK